MCIEIIRGPQRFDRHSRHAWRYQRIEQAAHWIQLDQPEALSAHLVDGLQSDPDTW